MKFDVLNIIDVTEKEKKKVWATDTEFETSHVDTAFILFASYFIRQLQ